MKVMIYLGKATPKVVNGLKSMSDGNDYMVYTSVSNFVQEAELRHLSFSRVVFNNKFVPRGEQDYVALNEFIRSFSSATELVMVISDGDKENEDLFNKYFSSPLHSCAIVKGAASMDFFKDIVSLPMVTVKARYYALDKGSSSGGSDKSNGSKIGGLRGGAKKSVETNDPSSGSAVVSEPVSNTESSPKNSPSDSSAGSVTNVGSNVGFSASGLSTPAEDSERVPGFISEAPPLHEPPSSSGEDFVSEDEDAILSVGAFGSAHSDTDMFDEEDDPGEIVEEPANTSVDEEERRRREELEEQNRIAAEIQEKNRVSAPNVRISAEKPAPRKNQWGNLNGTPYVANTVNYIISVTGSSSAQQIVDDAVRMMEAGMKVLILDMDFVNNGILSFINIKKFYETLKKAKISDSVYTEEGIDVLSGGYGFVPSAEEVCSTVKSVVETYDIVLVDCPDVSLRFLSEELLGGGNIIVFSDSDPSQIVATSLALTSRNICTLRQERLIMGRCKPLIIGNKHELIQETVSNMLFANGCWLQ